eukprot:gnl/TRDRNA2_/TRDRNA2_131004_c0_seq1.p1 gnl/TRDRNA2_/TRDRNA2_131004_c0~~gnl/TRDRNA2_/TRDRNA2_131004_c0_seq1.p1  ORF type:complete len:330 (+),score=100.33 gnl/TRDRNA2_/TRDRNA2_131004_c0_seq1:68-991(+)
MPPELTDEELAKLSKAERGAYHKARRGAAKAAAAAERGRREAAGEAVPDAAQQPSKAERRKLQEAQRLAKQGKRNQAAESEELLAELKLQGLTEEQAHIVIAEMSAERTVDGGGDEEEEDDEEIEDLLASVQRWMREQGDAKATSDVLRDFNMSVRFQGHVDTTPPDHLGAVLQIIADKVCSDTDVSEPRLQPATVAKRAERLFGQWGELLEQLYSKIDDVLVALDAVVRGVRDGVGAVRGFAPGAGKDIVEVGVLMALRENVKGIADEDLLTGCQRLQPKSRVLEKFIAFLEEVLEDEEEDDEDDS